jgi:beta-lactamase class A
MCCFGAQVDQPFPAASLIKLGIAAFVKEKAADDPSQLERQVTLPESVGGAGILRFMSPQAWRVRDLLTLMLTVSDNLATNALLTTYGLADHCSVANSALSWHPTTATLDAINL